MDEKSVASRQAVPTRARASKQTASVDITSAVAAISADIAATNGLAWADPVFPPANQPDQCPICHQQFYPGAVRQRLCSPACRRHAYLERMRAGKVGTPEACLRCGIVFTRTQREEAPFCGSFCKWIFWKPAADLAAESDAQSASAAAIGEASVSGPSRLPHASSLPQLRRALQSPPEPSSAGRQQTRPRKLCDQPLASSFR